MSFKLYKLTAGESDPNYDYRIRYDTGSGHGGNLAHYLDDVVQRNRLAKPNMTFTAGSPWIPTGRRTPAGRCCQRRPNP
ncbi:MAG TPA: hypothetical protein VNO79_15335 [Actinomycetota bacterium]|nr:hypothetical protein [Actinomycetota bacterium]